MLRLAEDVSLDERDIHARFVRAASARCENARGKATAVELRLDIGATSLPEEVKTRLRALGGRDVARSGVLLTVSRGQNSKAANREAALERLLTLVLRAATSPKGASRPYPQSRRRSRRAGKEYRGQRGGRHRL